MYLSTNDVINTPLYNPDHKEYQQQQQQLFILFYFTLPFKSWYVNCWIRYLKLLTEVDPEISRTTYSQSSIGTKLRWGFSIWVCAYRSGNWMLTPDQGQLGFVDKQNWAGLAGQYWIM